jgi:hypothetical protein
VKRFASGKERQNVQFKKELVTEVRYQKYNTSPKQSTIDDEFTKMVQRSLKNQQRPREQCSASLLDSSGSWESSNSATGSRISVDPPPTNSDLVNSTLAHYSQQQILSSPIHGLSKGGMDPPTIKSNG